MLNRTLFEDFCRSCGSCNTVELPEAPNNTHRGRLTCGDCQAFIKWLPKPKISEVCIIRLLQNPTLQVWEKRFLKTVILRTPTIAEQIVIAAIEAKLNPVSSNQ
jgi:hypothetical protein